MKCALAHFLPDGTRVNSKNFMLTGAGHNGGKQNTRRSSFNNSTFGNTSSSTLKNTSAIVTGATPPEYENSFSLQITLLLLLLLLLLLIKLLVLVVILQRMSSTMGAQVRCQTIMLQLL